MRTVMRRDKSPGKQFWRKFEEEVERAVASLGNARVQRDVRIPGAVSGRPRQIDVLARGEVAGCPMTVVFEAKCYGGIVQIGRVDELVGKALDVAAQSAVLYSPKGFSSGARARAAGTKNSPLRIGAVKLEVDWLEAEPAVEETVLTGYRLPHQIPRSDSVAYDVMSRIPDLGPYPARPVETDDYGRFFRGEAPLFISR
ncbi:restriction endonuclease [Streptomyces sp. NPDC102394]|uniref:restriction endonuclease n=1 Tax=Streptomyces sp. NPDC102394 TaxID=3366167 RepID=UPI0037FB9BC7